MQRRDAVDFLAKRHVAAEDLHDRGEHARRELLEDRGAEALLGAEVVVQQRLIDARLLRNLLHARSEGAAADEDGTRGVEDAGFGESIVLARRTWGSFRSRPPAGFRFRHLI